MQPPMWRFLKKLTVFLKKLPYGPAIALLGIYPKGTKMLIQRGTCTPMFIAMLSTIAKLWKEPTVHQLMNGLRRCYVNIHIYNGILMKKNEILPFATMWMELEGIMLSEISQSERQIPYDFLICGI